MLGDEDARLWWKSFRKLIQAMELRCEIQHLKSKQKVEAIALTSIFLETEVYFATRYVASRLGGRHIHVGFTSS